MAARVEGTLPAMKSLLPVCQRSACRVGVDRLLQLPADAGRLPRSARPALPPRRRRPRPRHRVRAGRPDQHLQRRPVRLYLLPAGRRGSGARPHRAAAGGRDRREIAPRLSARPRRLGRDRPLPADLRHGRSGRSRPVFLRSGPDGAKGDRHCRRLLAARQSGKRRHHPRHQRQGDDRARASPPIRCCPATPSMSANACSDGPHVADQAADRPLLSLTRRRNIPPCARPDRGTGRRRSRGRHRLRFDHRRRIRGAPVRAR